VTWLARVPTSMPMFGTAGRGVRDHVDVSAAHRHESRTSTPERHRPLVGVQRWLVAALTSPWPMYLGYVGYAHNGFERVTVLLGPYSSTTTFCGA